MSHQRKIYVFESVNWILKYDIFDLPQIFPSFSFPRRRTDNILRFFTLEFSDKKCWNLETINIEALEQWSNVLKFGPDVWINVIRSTCVPRFRFLVQTVCSFAVQHQTDWFCIQYLETWKVIYLYFQFYLKFFQISQVSFYTKLLHSVSPKINIAFLKHN